MENNILENLIQENSPDGGFLQSEEWRNFQEAVGRKAFHISGDNFWANIVEHKLPIVGKYFYIPRGPILENKNDNSKIKNYINKLINLAESNNAGWIRIEPANKEALDLVKENVSYRIVEAPHDMQPKEILVIDITKSEEQLLSEMKSKTRYNVRLAEKKGVKIREDRKDINEFIRLTKIMAKRQGITVHPDEYYRKMTEIISRDVLKLYVAEYENRVVAANLVAFYGNTCTYLHGASDDEYKNVMAPFLLQWKQIQDAKDVGCKKYDFGGIKLDKIVHRADDKKSWSGITRFKTGFAPDSKPIEFSGSYDIVVNNLKYCLYRIIQKTKSIVVR